MLTFEGQEFLGTQAIMTKIAVVFSTSSSSIGNWCSFCPQYPEYGYPAYLRW